MWPGFMPAFVNDTNQTQFPLTPVYPSSFPYPSFQQEEARLHPVKCTRDDEAGGAAGDPQHCQRLWMHQCPHMSRSRPFFGYPHHLRGALHQPGSPAVGHERHQLVFRASAETKPEGEWKKRRISTQRGPEYGRKEQNPQRRLSVGANVRRAVTETLWGYWWDVHAPWQKTVPNIVTSHLKKLDLRYCSYCTSSLTFSIWRCAFLMWNRLHISIVQHDS